MSDKPRKIPSPSVPTFHGPDAVPDPGSIVKGADTLEMPELDEGDIALETLCTVCEGTGKFSEIGQRNVELCYTCSGTGAIMTEVGQAIFDSADVITEFIARQQRGERLFDEAQAEEAKAKEKKATRTKKPRPHIVKD